jgi:hypothetical protein
MLDASIRDVVDSLSNNDKTSVLLYAMERLPLNAEYVSYGIGQNSPIIYFCRKFQNCDRERGPVLSPGLVHVPG